MNHPATTDDLSFERCRAKIPIPDVPRHNTPCAHSENGPSAGYGAGADLSVMKANLVGERARCQPFIRAVVTAIQSMAPPLMGT